MDTSTNYMELLPSEIVAVIIDLATDDPVDLHADAILPAIMLTCRRLYAISCPKRPQLSDNTIVSHDLMRYYLCRGSPTGVAFAASLGYRFLQCHTDYLIKNSPQTVNSIFNIAAVNIDIPYYVERCVRKGLIDHIESALKRGYIPAVGIINAAVESTRCNIALLLLNHIPRYSDRLCAIEASIRYSFNNMSLFKMLDLGLRLKHLDADPRYISMVIYAIYKHSPNHDEPEFIIRWILDNLQYQPIFIPMRESFTRVNSMLRQHKFKFMRCDPANVEHLFSVWI